jgi:Arc/MetJ family transcription regulator
LTVVCITLDTGMHMRTTMILDEALLAEARALTGLAEKTAVVHEGLRALIARESGRRLAALGGTAPQAWAPGRRRPVKRGTRKRR